MREKRVKVLNKVGLHARPAVLFVKTAKRFSSKVEVCKGESCANAKSIVEVLSLDVRCGDEITIRASGPDEEEAVNTLVNLVESRFGEE